MSSLLLAAWLDVSNLLICRLHQIPPYYKEFCELIGDEPMIVYDDDGEPICLLPKYHEFCEGEVASGE